MDQGKTSGDFLEIQEIRVNCDKLDPLPRPTKRQGLSTKDSTGKACSGCITELCGKMAPKKLLPEELFSFREAGTARRLAVREDLFLLGLGILINVWLNVTTMISPWADAFEEIFARRRSLCGEKHQATLLVGKGNAFAQDLFVLSAERK